MRAGRILQCAPPAQVYRAPVDPWVADFLGEAVLLPAQIQNGLATTALGTLTIPPAAGPGDALVLIRPEQVEVLPTRADGTVPATITRQDFFGHDALLALDVDGGTRVSARLFDVASHAFEVGNRVGLRVRGPVLAYPEPDPRPGGN